MICRKCGAEIPDNAIRCSNCGIKVNMYCPECKTINLFGTNFCTNCGFELIKYCPSCNASNIFSAKECRKCHTSLEKNTEAEQNNTDFDIVRPFSLQQSTYSVEENIEPTENIDSEVDIVLENNEVQETEKIFSVEDEIAVENDEIEDFEQTEEYVIQEDAIQDEEIIIDTIEEIFDESVMESLEESQEEIQEEVSEDNTEDGEDLAVEIQPQAVLKTINLVKNSLTKHIIAINGTEGSGKSAVLKQVGDNLSKQGYISLYGSCTPLVQITSFGFFQDAFLRMLGFPPYINNVESFAKEFKKSEYANIFNFLNSQELNLFLNIFYPYQKDKFEHILDNKKKIFSILEKVLKSFLVNNNLIISIDNFELLDGASYDFIVHMLQNGFFNNRLKLIVAYQENKSIQSYFDVDSIDENLFETILIKKFSKEEIINAVSESISIDIEKILDEVHLSRLVEKSDGNAIRLEQEIALLFDSGYISVENNAIVIKEEHKPEFEPTSFEELIKLRLNTLTPNAKNILYMAAMLGFRFSNYILCSTVDMPLDKAENVLNFLIEEAFVEEVDNYTCEFRSLTLWKLIYQEAKADLLYKENSERLYSTLKPLVLASNLQKLISCTEAISKNEAFIIWQNTANIAAKLGDTNLYVIAQKQCLKVLEEQDRQDSEIIKSQIYEEIGKLLCEKSPSEAITYLANVLDAEIKDSNIKKVIDLSSYFIKSCYMTGNYFGVSESIESVIKCLENVDNVSELDIALIKTRKLKALLNIGNSEQIINIVNEDIIPELERALTSGQLEIAYKNIILNAWLLSKITLAKAYAQQGNNQIMSVISEIRQFIEKYNYNLPYYIFQIEILEAASKTIIGDINASNNILNGLLNKIQNNNADKSLIAEWNLINVINRVLTDRKKDLKVDLFELAAYTNNINEHFIKNIVKLILGYVIQDEGNTDKALGIYNEEITYFAKEKVAIGALLSWSLIVQLTIRMGDIDKALNTATKSLEIAQSPKINNHFFIIAFQKYLAEIYLRKTDFVASKMYLEKSLMLAKQFDLKYQLIELYVAYAKYLEELMKENQSHTPENVNNTLEMYNKAILIAKELRLANMIELVTRERSSFKTFCQLNSIEN